MNFQPYLFDPRGDGVRDPIRQASIKTKRENLIPSVAAKLYTRRKAKPIVYNSAITSRYNITDVIPSNFAQHGRGKKTGGSKGIKIAGIVPGNVDSWGLGRVKSSSRVKGLKFKLLA